jgi:hypothetical protein
VNSDALHEPLRMLAMQKVVGSSPIIRLKQSPASAGLFCCGVAIADEEQPSGQVWSGSATEVPPSGPSGDRTLAQTIVVLPVRLYLAVQEYPGYHAVHGK